MKDYLSGVESGPAGVYAGKIRISDTGFKRIVELFKVEENQPSIQSGIFAMFELGR